MLGRPKKKYRTLYTTSIDNDIIEWFRTQPRIVNIADFINNAIRKDIKELQEKEKSELIVTLRAQQQEINRQLNALESERVKKELEVELKHKAEAQYAVEQQEIRDLQGNLDFFSKQGQEYKKFLQKLEWQVSPTLPKNKLARLRALDTALKNACLEGEGLELMPRLKEQVIK